MFNNRNLRTRWVIPLLGLLVLAALPVDAARSEGDEEIVTMAIHGGGASFSPRVSFDRMTLTVGGQGYAFRRSFTSGQSASFAPVDKEGFALPDGTYKWEIVVSSKIEDWNREVLEDGEISADGRNVEVAQVPSGRRQSGVFTIQNGAMVDPNLVERESGRAEQAPLAEAAVPPSAEDRAAEHRDMDKQ